MTREEAINIVRNIYQTDAEKEALGTLIPELRESESEDERIRRTLVEYFGPEVQLDLVRGVPIQKIRDWLEKQKEQKTEARSERVIKAARRVLNNWLDGTDCPDVSGDFAELEYAIREYDGEEKQKEHFRDFTKKVEQKPTEWSANDKAFIKDCAHILDENGYAASAERLLSMFPVNPTEWSEEDELMRTAVIQTLERFVGYRGTVGMQIDWLKSLRPSWKPSDEQMIALYNMIPFVKSVGGPSEAVKPLESLYEDLKKL